VQSVEEAERE